MKYWILGLFIAGCISLWAYVFLDEKKKSADSGPIFLGILAMALWSISFALLIGRIFVILWEKL